MDSETFFGPVNIGSDEMVTINQLAEYVCGIAIPSGEIAGKKLTIKHIDGPLGVRGRNPVLSESEGSDNKLIKDKLACPALTGVGAE